METIEIKCRFSGNVIFSHEQENNSIKATVEAAVKIGTSLDGASLDGARLDGARLDGARLNGARLNGAYLVRARLNNARLDGASLLRVIGDMKFIFSMQLDCWHISFTKDVLQIGCQNHPIAEWKEFSDEMISKMDSRALVFCGKWKEFIFKAIDLSLEKSVV